MAITINGSGTVTGISAGGLPDGSITPADLSQPLTLDTAKTATGTAVDFTGIPSWVKRITVMLDQVSTNGASAPQLQLGAGSVTSSGYSGNVFNTNASGKNIITSGHPIYPATGLAGLSHIGHVVFSLLGSNTWVGSGVTYNGSGTGEHCVHTSRVVLSGTLDRIRITTVNGTDTFDAGSINILYE